MAENTINGKVYIGKVEREVWERKGKDPIQGRWQEHLNDAKRLETKRENLDQKIRGTYLENAINKYCVDNFDVKEIDTADSFENLNEKEKENIQKYDSFNPNYGYNMTYGGDGGSPIPEVRERISETLEKYYQDNPEAARELGEKISQY